MDLLSSWTLRFLMLMLFNIQANCNNDTTNDAAREGRVNGRIEKLSGNKIEQLICTGEGFQADPKDCTVFYRCMKGNNGRFTVFRYQCGPGTIYDPDTQICNHPKSTKRLECMNVIIPQQDQNFENEIETLINSFISNKPHRSVEKTTSHGTMAPFLTTKIDLKGKNPVTASKNTRFDDVCTTNGFVGDIEDCRKFYRCIGNGRGGFLRYEFYCNELTVWDDDIKSCNHPWAVRRRRCGSKDSSMSDIPNFDMRNEIVPTTTNSFNFGSKFTNVNLPTASITQKPMLVTKRIIYNQETTKLSFSTKAPSDWADRDNLIQHSEELPKPLLLTTSKDIKSKAKPKMDNNDCKSSGFYGDKNDCRKFYRCVENGKGFTKYEYNCGEGTVWDSSIDACNHAWAVKDCNASSDQNEKPETTTSSSAMTTVSLIQTTQESSGEDDDVGYGQKPSPTKTTTTASTTTTTSKTTTKLTTKTPEENSNKGNVCTSSGFMGDENDCNKFYRCVDNGNGGFTKYEFSCGDGTVWDPKIEACNHAWAVEKCGGTNTDDIYKETSSSSTTSTTQNYTDEIDNGYSGNNEQPNEIQESTTSKASSTTSTSTSSPSKGNKCDKSGFMGDPDDCNKFYRCVDDGNGGFTRYDFSCGDGTVWDPKIEACNHAWAVENCGGTNIDDIQKETTTVTTTQSHDHDEIDNGYNNFNDQTNKEQETTTIKGTSTSSEASTSSLSTSNKCESSGFMSDTEDCKKFYRCVDDGKGGFIRYEFSCGEGTIWDPSIESCNHETDVKDCNQQRPSENPSSSAPEIMTENSENEDTGYNSPVTTSSSSTTSTETYTSSTSEPVETNAVCKKEGFIGDKNNCKKFYRCVSDGKGGYTQYEFTCGEGTVWDSEINSCNHENAVKTPCTGGSAMTVLPDSDEIYTETTSTTQSSTEKPSTTEGSQLETNNDTCTSEGFFADSDDCRKFYRCVSNDKGGFTKYEFTCSEGTIWVQEINACDYDDGSNCSKSTEMLPEKTTQSTLTSQSPETTNEPQSESTKQEQEKEDEPESSSQASSSNDNCESEGFYPDSNDCKKFHRCVDNGKGGYTKYDFTCGEGTAWDNNIQSCNHISEVQSCQSSSQNNEQSQPVDHDENESDTTSQSSSSTTQKSTTNQSTTGSSKPSDQDKCEQEGYYGNSNDCKKFYRCVDNGNGGYTKYDFTCGDGTIWDQDITACNHPQDVANPSCKDNMEQDSSQESSSSSSTTTSTTTESSSSPSSSTESSTQSPESSTKKSSKGVNCTQAGFYADPGDCKKFYRCVDWDGDGKKFSVFHFDCGEGTIWDPALDTCNYEDSVYPPRDCSGSQSQSETITEESSTTEETKETEQTTTEESTTDSTTQSTTESTTQSTTQSTTESTTQSTTESTTQSTTESTTQSTTESTTQSTTESTTQSTTESTTQSTTESTTQSTTESTSTTQSSSTTQSNDNEETTTEQSTTTQQTTDSQTEQTTEQQTEQTTSSSTTQSSTDQTTSSNDDSTTESSKEESSTTEDNSSNTTQQTDDSSTTTESSESTTSSSSSDKCPETDDDQSLFVCPTSFRRHPKYCNMFYQCTEDDNSHEVKIATFNCPNNTIYDESKTQCVEEEKADEKCDGEIAQRRRFKRLDADYKEPITVGKEKHSCPAPGHYPFERKDGCSPAFLKCQKSASGKLRGFVYQCPEGYVYWSVSRRCERKYKLKDCQVSSNDWRGRWNIPVERLNVAP